MRPASASRVSSPGSPGPAPTSQTSPGANTGYVPRNAASACAAEISAGSGEFTDGSGSVRIGVTEASAVFGRIQRALCKICRIEKSADEYQRRALHGFERQLGPNVVEPAPKNAFVGPARSHHDRDRAVRAVVRNQLFHDGVHGVDGEVNGQRRAAGC